MLSKVQVTPRDRLKRLLLARAIPLAWFIFESPESNLRNCVLLACMDHLADVDVAVERATYLHGLVVRKPSYAPESRRSLKIRASLTACRNSDS